MQSDLVHFHEEDEGEDQDSFLFEISSEDYLRELQALETDFSFSNVYEQENDYDLQFHFHSERLDEAEEVEEFAFLPHQDEAIDEMNGMDYLNQDEMTNFWSEREPLDWMGDREGLNDDKVMEGGVEEEEEEERELDYSSLSVGEYTEEEKRMFLVTQYYMITYAFS